MLNEIFRMQRELNVVVGRDTVGAPQSLKDEWLFQYLVASELELYEFAISEDRNNDKIEVIDMLHFNVSICHILNISADDVISRFDFKSIYGGILPDGENTTDDLTANLWKDLSQIKQQIEFKWWSKFIKENPEKQFKVIKDRDICVDGAIKLLIDTLKLCPLVGMTPDDIFDIYKKKHQVNLDRQANDYDDRNKTEADNLGIIAEIERKTIEEPSDIADDLIVKTNEVANIFDTGLDADSSDGFDVKEELSITPDSIEIVSSDDSKSSPEDGGDAQDEVELAKSTGDVSVASAWDRLTHEMVEDESWAWTMHCNVAMSIFDTGVDVDLANKAAARVIQHLFKFDTEPLIKKYRKQD